MTTTLKMAWYRVALRRDVKGSKRRFLNLGHGAGSHSFSLFQKDKKADDFPAKTLRLSEDVAQMVAQDSKTWSIQEAQAPKASGPDLMTSMFRRAAKPKEAKVRKPNPNKARKAAAAKPKPKPKPKPNPNSETQGEKS